MKPINEAGKNEISSSSTGGEASSKKRDVENSENSQPLKKRFTTAKDRREHLSKNFRNRKGNRDDNNRQRDWNNELQKSRGDDVDSNEPKEPRKPKKKAAVLVGFCGTGYQGMQM